MAPSLEIHLEWPWHALWLPEAWLDGDWWGVEVAHRLRRMLARHHVQATWYVVGQLAKSYPDLISALAADGHAIGSHGYWHRHGERDGDASDQQTRAVLPHCVGYRSPYWDTTACPGRSGGVWFRVLPYQWLKRNIQRTGVLWLHPHDLEDWYLGGPLRRHLFFCRPWERLERLLTELTWDAPRRT